MTEPDDRHTVPVTDEPGRAPLRPRLRLWYALRAGFAAAGFLFFTDVLVGRPLALSWWWTLLQVAAWFCLNRILSGSWLGSPERSDGRG